MARERPRKLQIRCSIEQKKKWQAAARRAGLPLDAWVAHALRSTVLRRSP